MKFSSMIHSLCLERKRSSFLNKEYHFLDTRIMDTQLFYSFLISWKWKAIQLVVSGLHCHCKRLPIVFWIQHFCATDVAGAFYEISFDSLTRKLRGQMNRWFDMLFGPTKVAFQISVRSRDWFRWVRSVKRCLLDTGATFSHVTSTSLFFMQLMKNFDLVPLKESVYSDVRCCGDKYTAVYRGTYKWMNAY